ncbi:hypothetical protein V6N12_062853 [Hibiscus sabdariffa]|uniref:Uncharacterized protein n=1 Tax=Hibiscus sabdariffa TaxID=183260 RepID=A0ABR2FA08_9ROSI
MVKLSQVVPVVPTTLPPAEDANHTSSTMAPMSPAHCMEQDVPLSNTPLDMPPATTSAPHSTSPSPLNNSQATQNITAISSNPAAPSSNPACIEQINPDLTTMPSTTQPESSTNVNIPRQRFLGKTNFGCLWEFHQLWAPKYLPVPVAAEVN